MPKPSFTINTLQVQSYQSSPKMENIITNPGLQHLAEEIFWNLDVKNLKNCAQINQSCKQILQNPIFCLRKFEKLSKKNQLDWIKVIQLVTNFDKGIAIISYLKWNLKKEIVNPPCHSSPAVQNDFKKKIWENCKKMESSDENTEIVKILAPLTDNPNSPDNDGDTPIYMAARKGHTEIVKILASFTDSPNSPEIHGRTPILEAVQSSYTEIVKILVPFITNNDDLDKLIFRAKTEEIRKILKSF